MQRALRVLVFIPVVVLTQGLTSDLANAGDDLGGTLKAQQLFYREPGMIGVEVRSDEGMLTLSGSVATDADRTRAGEIARQVGGIVEVRNRLRVVSPPAEPPPDADLLAEIEAKIAKDSELAPVRPMLDIQVEDSNVTVKGQLPGWGLVRALIRGIRRIPGIRTLDFMRLTADP